MNLLIFLTDAFGGRGGIAKFNRDTLTALCSHPECSRVVAVPRVLIDPTGHLPQQLDFRVGAAKGKAAFLRAAAAAALERAPIDGVICAHIHLLPLAAAAAWARRVPLTLVIYGIDAWQPSRSIIANRLTRHIDALVAISETTRDRFLDWSCLERYRARIVPPSIDLSLFQPGPKRPDLLERHRLNGRKVIMTVGRLVARERYKGFDEVLNVLPELARAEPTIIYLVVGDGNDRSRLESKASQLGVRDRVVFTGYVDEGDKADYFRLADAYVMPSRGEGFGIVFLEAMACGVPVVASLADASREAIRNGALGLAVDPDSPNEICQAVLQTLACPRRVVPSGLEYFSYDRFVERWHAVVDNVIANSRHHAS
jgi:phosphatidylinositol alpha-1,6-mannosyltransferase